MSNLWCEIEICQDTEGRGTWDKRGVYGRNRWDGIVLHSNSKFYIDYEHYWMETIDGADGITTRFKCSQSYLNVMISNVEERLPSSWKIWQVSNSWNSVFKRKPLLSKLSGPDILLPDYSSYGSSFYP